MIYHEGSYLVKLYVDMILDKGYPKASVPNLFNLRDVVYSMTE